VALFHSLLPNFGVGDEKPGKEETKKEGSVDTIDSVEGLYRRTVALAVQGKYAEALPIYEKLFTLSVEFDNESVPGQDAMLYFDYASCQYFVGKFREALETCRLVEAKQNLMRSHGVEPQLHDLLVVRIRVFQCLRELNPAESEKELKEFDRLLVNYRGKHRDKFVQWRSGIEEPLSPEK